VNICILKEVLPVKLPINLLDSVINQDSHPCKVTGKIIVLNILNFMFKLATEREKF